MTTFTSSEGLVITHTTELLETILLQLDSSSNYYTSGEHDIIYIEIDYNNVLLLDHTYHINKYISYHVNRVFTYLFQL